MGAAPTLYLARQASVNAVWLRLYLKLATQDGYAPSSSRWKRGDLLLIYRVIWNCFGIPTRGRTGYFAVKGRCYSLPLTTGTFWNSISMREITASCDDFLQDYSVFARPIPCLSTMPIAVTLYSSWLPDLKCTILGFNLRTLSNSIILHFHLRWDSTPIQSR